MLTEDLGKHPAPNVLVACPTYAGMAYSLAQWADAYHAFTYSAKGALMVDNSDDNLHYSHLIRAQGIPCIYEPTRFNFLWDTMELSWRKIVEYAHDEGYDLIASIEADVICPPNTLEVLVGEWQRSGPKAVVAHRYHPRGIDNIEPAPEGMVVDQKKLETMKQSYWFDTLGCVLFPTELMYDSRNEWKAIVEVELYMLAKDNGYQRVRLKELLDIKHLNDPDPHKKMAFPMPLNQRAHPADLTVKHDVENIPMGTEASAQRGIFDMPLGGPVEGDYHGRRTDSPGDPEKAQEARDNLKWSSLTPEEDREKSLEEQNRSLRLMCNTLFSEIERLKEESRREDPARDLYGGQYGGRPHV